MTVTIKHIGINKLIKCEEQSLIVICCEWIELIQTSRTIEEENTQIEWTTSSQLLVTISHKSISDKYEECTKENTTIGSTKHNKYGLCKWHHEQSVGYVEMFPMPL